MTRQLLSFVVILAVALLDQSLLAQTSTAPQPSPADTPALARKAERFYLARDWGGAIKLYGQLIQLNPASGLYQYRLGDSLVHARRYAEAVAPLEQAVELGAFQYGPVKWVHRGEAAYLLAAAHAGQGEIQKSLEATRLSLEHGLRNIRKFHDPRFEAIANTPEFRELVWFAVDDVDSLSRDEKFRRDLKFSIHELKRLHYSPFRTHTEGEIDSLVKALDAEIPQLTDDQIYVRMLRIISAFGDAHTRWLRETPLLPVVLFVYPEGIHVLGASKDHTDLVGAKILEITGHSADEVLAQAVSLAPVENRMTADREAAGLLRSIVVLRGLGLAPAEGPVAIKVEDARGQIRDVQLSAQQQPLRREDYVFAVPGCADAVPHCLRNRHEMFWHEILPGSKTMYCQLNGIGHGKQLFHKYVEKLFAEIESTGIERLVLDLRWNGGGNTFLNPALIECVLRSGKFRKPGNLFVIVGRNTFSAAINTTVDLERRTTAILVGEPPSSPPNFVGESVEVVLPASRWPLSISDLWWQTSYPMDYRQMVTPQIYAPPTAAALRAHRDPAMEAIEAYIATNPVKSKTL
jgi:tetratricopeptide (TPR) repeat protein